jgi:hypothetical protein
MDKITENLKYIYGENLVKDGKPIRVTLTISNFIDDEFCDTRGQKTNGFSVCFQETKKMLGVTGSTVTRQLFLATGSEEKSGCIGKKIVLYAVQSKRSVSGWAVRVGSVETK